MCAVEEKIREMLKGKYPKKIGGEIDMGLFTKHCEICGMRIDKNDDVVRLGKHFDSQEHAEQYVKLVEERKQTYQEDQTSPGLLGTGGGCC